MNDYHEIIQQATVWILPIIFAITLHEAAHGWIAKVLGDDTAYRLGRVTINPIPHIDPVGTVLLPLILLMIPGGFVFGWAKPVPVNWLRLRQPRRDVALVSLAGPGANLLMACAWAVLYKIGVAMEMEFLAQVGVAGITINIVLIALNMLPLLPLDGGRVTHSLLPASLAREYAKLEPYGLIILIALLALGMLEIFMRPVINLLFSFIVLVFALN